MINFCYKLRQSLDAVKTSSFSNLAYASLNIHQPIGGCTPFRPLAAVFSTSLLIASAYNEPAPEQRRRPPTPAKRRQWICSCRVQATGCAAAATAPLTHGGGASPTCTPSPCPLWLPAGVAAGRHFATTSDEDTHDDFKPQIRGQPSSSVAEQIEADVNSREVFLYMKGVPQAPMCGFSQMACRILDAYGEHTPTAA